MVPFFLLLFFLQFQHITYGEPYVLSDGQIRIMSLSSLCNIGRIEINDNKLNGWSKLSDQCLINIPTNPINKWLNSLPIGNSICNQLGFTKFISFYTNNIDISQNITKTTDLIGYNNIDCFNKENIDNICNECEFELNENLLCDDNKYDIYIECDQFNNNNNLKCVKYNLSSESDPFYEDDTFILVVFIIGFVLISCCIICICHYCQVQYDTCLACKGCIDILMCKCAFGYEGDDDDFDVGPQKKAELAATQQNLPTAYW